MCHTRPDNAARDAPQLHNNLKLQSFAPHIHRQVKDVVTTPHLRDIISV